MNGSRAVNEFLSLSGNFLRSLRSEGHGLPTSELRNLRTQLHILQVEVTALEIACARSLSETNSTLQPQEARRWAVAPRYAVEFYQNDRWLTESINAFIKVGFDVHETVVLISTAVHWTMFQDALSPDELEDERLVFLDARDLLAQFMVNDWPNESRFIEVLGAILLPAGQKGPLRRLSGKVDVLWAEGKTGAATRLEELWNSIGARHHFSLVCGYPKSAFSRRRGSAITI